MLPKHYFYIVTFDEMNWYVTVNDAAIELQISTHGVRKLIYESKLEYKKEWGLYYIKWESLQKYKENRRTRSNNPLFLNRPQIVPIQRLVPQEKGLSITELIEKIEDSFWWDMLLYMSVFGCNNSIIIPNDCMQLDDLLNLLPAKFKWNWEKKFKKILLFLSSPWWILEASVKFADIIRQYSESFEVIIPYMAKSAASLICLLSDKIYMTTISELWPIDPIIENPAKPWNFIPAKAVDDFIKYYTKEANYWSALSNALLKIFESKIDPYILWSWKSSLLYSQNEINKALKWKINESLLDRAINIFTTDNVSHNHPITYNNLKGIWLKNIEQIKDEEILNCIKTLFTAWNNYMNRNNIIKTFWSRNRNYDTINRENPK